jgi:hypothetical protein
MCQRTAVKVSDMNFMYWIRRRFDCLVRAGRAGSDVAKPIEALLRRFTANASKIRRDIPIALHAYRHIVG